MPAPSRVPRAVVATFAVAIIIGALVLLGPRLGGAAAGPNLICNGSFEEGAFAHQDDVDGMERMHLLNDTRLSPMFCAADRTRGWRVVRPRVATVPPNDAAAWFQFPGAPPLVAAGRRHVDLTGTYDVVPFGQISQDFPTELGKKYDVEVWLLNDPKFPPPPSVTLIIGDAGNPPTNLRPTNLAAPPVTQLAAYRPHVTFTASAVMTRLIINGAGTGNSIPVDAVSVRVLCPFLDVFCR